VLASAVNPDVSQLGNDTRLSSDKHPCTAADLKTQFHVYVNSSNRCINIKELDVNIIIVKEEEEEEEEEERRKYQKKTHTHT
jgi:hypothetical protein